MWPSQGGRLEEGEQRQHGQKVANMAASISISSWGAGGISAVAHAGYVGV
jgi:hypothetical protein